MIGRNVAPEKRSWAMGITAAAGSFGQFLMVPIEGGLIAAFGWQEALFILACAVLMILPLAFGLREPQREPAPGVATQSMGAALREAFGDRSFLLLTAGYFVCGFQVVFIGVHMPSYLKDQGLTPGVATTALALIGLFNVFGTYTAGMLGRPAAEALPAVGHLHAALGGHRRLPAGAADAAQRLRVLLRDGLALALDRAARPAAWSPRSSACATCRCSAASSSSATRSAASSASGSAGGCTT